MAGHQMQLEAQASQARVRLEGTFDASAAVALRRSLDALDLHRVVLDFSQVRGFVDLAVGVLARELGGRALEVELLGLPEHHERLFRYLGFGVGPARARRTTYQPEELHVS